MAWMAIAKSLNSSYYSHTSSTLVGSRSRNFGKSADHLTIISELDISSKLRPLLHLVPPLIIAISQSDDVRLHGRANGWQDALSVGGYGWKSATIHQEIVNKQLGGKK